MIRVNLLPQARRKAGPEEQSQAWVAVLMGVLFLEAVALFLFHQSKHNELAKQRQINSEIQAQIAEIQKTVANHAQVKDQLAVFRQREEAIQKLQTARTGPTGVLLELAHVLTAGRGPTVDPDVVQKLRKDNPLAVPNPGWDVRRLWLTGYHEADRIVNVEGISRDGEDVAELARRLQLSSFFEAVKLLPATKTIEGPQRIEMRKFQLQAKVKY